MSGWEQAPSPSRVILWNCAIFESYLVMVRCYFLFLFACFLMKAGAQTLPLLPLHAYSHPDTVAKYHLQEVSLFGEDTLFYLAFNADHQLIRQRSGTRDFRYVYVAATKTEEQHFNALDSSYRRRTYYPNGTLQLEEAAKKGGGFYCRAYRANAQRQWEWYRNWKPGILHYKSYLPEGQLCFNQEIDRTNETLTTVEYPFLEHHRPDMFHCKVHLYSGDTLAYSRINHLGFLTDQWNRTTGEYLRARYEDATNYHWVKYQRGDSNFLKVIDGEVQYDKTVYANGSFRKFSVTEENGITTERRIYVSATGVDIERQLSVYTTKERKMLRLYQMKPIEWNTQRHELQRYDTSLNQLVEKLVLDADSQLVERHRYFHHRNGTLMREKHWFSNQQNQRVRHHYPTLFRKKKRLRVVELPSQRLICGGNIDEANLRALPIGHIHLSLAFDTDTAQREPWQNLPMVCNNHQLLLEDWLHMQQKHLSYPPMAQEVGIRGKHFVRIHLSPNGQIDSLQHLRTVHPILTREVERLLQKAKEEVTFMNATTTLTLVVKGMAGNLRHRFPSQPVESFVLLFDFRLD